MGNKLFIVNKEKTQYNFVMKVKSFLKYVEIQTKAASMIPFAAGTVLAFYLYRRFEPINFVLMFVSLLCFDMATTAINNYIDFKKARKKSGYGYEKHNAIVRDNISESQAILVIVVLLLTAVTSGFFLFLNTDIIVLLLGAVSFVTGVLYSAGPLPISRTPFGEVMSGSFMGFLIPFISLYIHASKGSILDLSFMNFILTVKVDILKVFTVFLYTVPAITGIGNIMLANNICDMEDDLENKRHTLPLYIGKEKALLLFKSLYYAAYLAVILACVLRLLPLTSLLFLLTYIPVRKNIKVFFSRQTKKETFSLAVKNFAIMNICMILTLLLGLAVELITNIW